MAEIDKLTLTHLLTVPLEVVLSPSPSALAALMARTALVDLCTPFETEPQSWQLFLFAETKRALRKTLKKKHVFTNFFDNSRINSSRKCSLCGWELGRKSLRPTSFSFRPCKVVQFAVVQRAKRMFEMYTSGVQAKRSVSRACASLVF